DTLLDLEVSGASKFELRMSEASSSVTVITADEMRALGHRTLADVLSSVRGLVVSSDRTYSYLGVRGFSAPGDYNTRILLLIDGNRVNDAVYDQAFLGSEFPLDLDLVERVEFIPGQGSAVHGSNALFGVVNVVTRRGGAGSASEVAGAVGSARSRQLRVTTRQAISPGSSLLLSATALHAAGSDASYAGSGISHDTDHERATKLFAKFEGNGLSATLIHADRTKGLSAFPGTVFGDPGNLFRDTQTLADASLQRPIDSLSRFKLRLYGGSYSFRGDYVIDATPVTLNRDRGEARWWGVEADLFSERFEAHKLVVGTDLQWSPRRDQSNADIAPAAQLYLDDHRSSRRYALFAEDQWTLTPALSLTAGLRCDRIEGDSAQFSPRVGVVGRPRDDVLLKFVHGTAFRPPNAYEASYAVPAVVGGYKGNPALRDERVRGDELTLEFRPSTASRWTVSAYANEARDLLVQNIDPADGLLVFNNGGTLRARGLEVEAEQSWQNGSHVRASVSLQHVHDAPDPALAEHNPARVGKLMAVLPIGAGWTLGSQTVGVGRRGVVPGYVVTHLNLSGGTPNGRARWSLGVRDLLDRRPLDPGSDSVLQPASPQDGRSLSVRLELTF
ncbi:MAG TPA: TonB-dependent receptor, partial [Albitalea sp.]|nr:TonB-dependent receptor [Albitalea sp.]